MDNLKHDPMGADAGYERVIRDHVKLRRNHEEREDGIRGKNRLWCVEMEDWYRVEENRRTT